MYIHWDHLLQLPLLTGALACIVLQAASTNKVGNTKQDDKEMPRKKKKKTYKQQSQIIEGKKKKKQITSRTPPVEYFKTRRKAVVLCPLDFAAGNTTSSPTTAQM